VELKYSYAESTAKPAALEISTTTIYLRTDISESLRTDEQGAQTVYWSYQEAKLTHRHSGYDNAYCCSAYRKGVRKCCTIHYISVKNIEKILLTAIRRVVCYVRDNDKDFVEKIRAASVIQAENTVKESKRELAKSKRRVDELDGIIRKLYEDNASGRIPDKHFDKMFAEYDTEQSALETKIAELQSDVDRFTADGLKADNFIDLAKRYTEFAELTPQLLNEFISRVEIHEKDKSGDKTKQKVDIYFNFIGNFQVPDDYDYRTPEERAAEEAERERLDKKNAYEKERKRKKYLSDWHKQDTAKKKELRAAIAAKPESELTPEEREFAAEDAAKALKKKEYMREYGAKRYQAKKTVALETQSQPSTATA
jgi:hypothetical protein